MEWVQPLLEHLLELTRTHLRQLPSTDQQVVS